MFTSSPMTLALCLQEISPRTQPGPSVKKCQDPSLCQCGTTFENALRPVKPCPGVPGIHLNADRTVSMTAALLCGAGASPVHKDRGCSADHDQIEDHAHAQRHAWEMLLWLKNGAHGRRARLARARRP